MTLSRVTNNSPSITLRRVTNDSPSMTLSRVTNDSLSMTLSWVTDPFRTGPKLNSILAKLSSPKVRKIQSYTEALDAGLMKYVYTVYVSETGNGMTTQAIREVVEEIAEIQYEPLTFGAELTSVDLQETNAIENFKSCIVGYVEKYCQTKVWQVLQTDYCNADDRNVVVPIQVVLTPLLESGSAIYRSRAELMLVQSECQYERLRGYHWVLTDPLAEFVCQQLASIPFVVIEDMVFIENEFRFIEDATRVEAVREQMAIVDAFLRGQKSQGYFRIGKVETPGVLELYSELGQMMGFRQVTEVIFQRVLPIHAGLGSDWMAESVDRIMRGQLPRIRISGWWTSPSYTFPFGAYQDPFESFAARLQFAIYRAYAALVGRNPVLEPFLPFARILDDLTIELPISTFEDVPAFLQQFPTDYTNLEQLTTLIPAQSMTQALLIRYFLSQNLNALSLTIPIRKMILVVTNVKLDNMTVSVGPLEAATLLATVRARVPPDFASLTLPELIQYIPLTEKPFLIPADSPLGRTSVSKQLFHEFGIRGLYPFDFVPSIKSLMPNFPEKYLIEPPGQPIAVPISTPTGPVRYQVKVEDQPLFEIELPPSGLDTFMTRLGQLWSCGWFLSAWATSVLWKTDRLSSTIQQSGRLLTPGDSTQNLQFELQKWSLQSCLPSSPPKMEKS